MTAAGSGRLEPLDGLRGLAALWVFVGHALNLSGAWIPILGRPLLAVDLFMMLSGALMVYQTTLRDPREPLARPDTWLKFWLRRFFRIAPVFYLAFALAMLIGPWLYGLREAAGVERTIDWARYHDHGPANVLLHLSFLFGVVPGYADRSPLPDWSIGLEMQFYLVFPFVLLLLRRVGYAAGALMLLALVGLLWLTAGDWLSAFSPQRPAALPLRLNIFLAGMLVMRARDLAGRPRLGLVLAAIVLGLVPLGPFGHWSELVVRGLSVAVLAVAMIPGLLPAGPLEALAGVGRALLSWTPLRRLGDVSYGVYLIHLLALIPAVALVTRHLPDAAPLVRAGAAFIGAAAVVYPAGWLIYRFIEVPGISRGRRVVGRLGPRNPSRSPA